MELSEVESIPEFFCEDVGWVDFTRDVVDGEFIEFLNGFIYGVFAEGCVWGSLGGGWFAPINAPLVIVEEGCGGFGIETKFSGTVMNGELVFRAFIGGYIYASQDE